MFVFCEREWRHYEEAALGANFAFAMAWHICQVRLARLATSSDLQLGVDRYPGLPIGLGVDVDPVWRPCDVI
ncbi:unnamed protein product [Taenia asiatica]|uniref:Nitroreductase domain-containing protein n=1 Tax=Taenia asiatica TaxID=60517 RepID=A0A0R3WHD1_TAEAS|nr:unnamed protein product [Taenia asiatica]